MDREAGERGGNIFFAVVLVVAEVHGDAGLHFDEIFEGAVFGDRGDFANQVLHTGGIGFEFFEAGEPIHEFHAKGIPEVIVEKERQAEMEELANDKMDA